MVDLTNEAMADLLKSSMQMDVDTKTFLIVMMGIYTAILLMAWVFTGSHIAMAGFAFFAAANVREIRKVNDLQERILQCDFSVAMSVTTQHLIRWVYAVTKVVEDRAALSSEQEK